MFEDRAFADDAQVVRAIQRESKRPGQGVPEALEAQSGICIASFAKHGNHLAENESKLSRAPLHSKANDAPNYLFEFLLADRAIAEKSRKNLSGIECDKLPRPAQLAPFKAASFKILFDFFQDDARWR